MSRQYPDQSDIDFLTDWAERKIIQTAQKDRASNFENVAALSRSVAFFLNTMHTGNASSQQSWLRRRISDTHYALIEMQSHKELSEKFNRSEATLIDTLIYIAEYYEENGWIKPNMNSTVELSSADSSHSWRLPSRWLMNKSDELDSLE